MARRCVLRRVFGVRLRMTWDGKKKAIWMEPDEDDMKSVDTESILRFFRAVSEWSNDFVWRNPGWKINGYANREEDDESDPQLEMPVQKWEEAEALLQAVDGGAGERATVPD